MSFAIEYKMHEQNPLELFGVETRLCGTFRKVSASASWGCPLLRVFFIKEKPVFAGTFELVFATWRCPLPRVSASRRFHCII